MPKSRKTREQLKEEIKAGEKEKDIYLESGREELAEEEDEITNVDEGFMKGYQEDGKMANCQNCKKVLEAEVVERDYEGETYRFCSEECATKFDEKRKKKK